MAGAVVDRMLDRSRSIGALRRRVRERAVRALDRVRPSYASDGTAVELERYFRPPPADRLRSCADALCWVAERYLEHRFDVLGSGWIRNVHGVECQGLEGHRYAPGDPVHADPAGRWLRGRINAANLEEARRIWRWVDADYEPLDWQLDVKSGYRWSERTWYRAIPTRPRPGADIKVPWELSRCQHLPQLALAYALALDGAHGFAEPERYAREFRNQVLDFIATNPPRFGVNWRGTMDVAIRVANWLVAYDLFRAYGATFDDPFRRALARSVYEHGRHIVANLEWSAQLRANHYLADVAGLLFVAAYLPRHPRADAWLAFSVAELKREVTLQFHADGSNFEASTCYHRLAAEIVAYATALALAVPPDRWAATGAYAYALIPGGTVRTRPSGGSPDREPEDVGGARFPGEYAARLEGMAAFTMHVTRPNGTVPQIGDNDSGRFLKLSPAFRRFTVDEARKSFANLPETIAAPGDPWVWIEDHLDHRSTVAALNGLLRQSDLARFAGHCPWETELVERTVGDARLSPPPGVRDDAASARGRRASLASLIESARRTADALRTIEVPVQGADAMDGLEWIEYPGFGLCIYRSRRLFLTFRCGAVGQRGNGGHAHNDQLSIVLDVDGAAWIYDPGTYVYTPLPRKRDAYRSVRAHFAPQVADGREPARLDLGPFRLSGPDGVPLYAGEDGCAGEIQYGKATVGRIVELTRHGLRITDYARGALLRPLPVELRGPGAWRPDVAYSPGYGIVVRS